MACLIADPYVLWPREAAGRLSQLLHIEGRRAPLRWTDLIPADRKRATRLSAVRHVS